MRRPLREESIGVQVARREPLDRVVRSVDIKRSQLSLQIKIFLGYVVLGVAVFFASTVAPENYRVVAAGVVTAVLGFLLPVLLLRVARVKELSNTALEVSRGDLSRPVRLDAGGLRDDIDELAVAIRDMQENLRELVGHIQHTALAVADSSNELQKSAEGVNFQALEVGTSMKKIAEGAESQHALVEEASTTITDMAAAIQRTAASAEESARVAGATSAAAEEGSKAAVLAGDRVKTVFTRIEAASREVFAFGEKTQEISKIVDAITQVAQQTNLLALNATIEAARAGEYGRGFAVVADEVRKLADSAGKSAEQISRLARDISSQSAAVVSAMKEGIDELGKGREDLTAIVRSMGNITGAAKAGADKVGLISEGAREQQKSSNAMVRAIQDIARVAKANAESTEAVHVVINEQTSAVAQMTASAQELTNLSVELQSVVRRFKLG